MNDSVVNKSTVKSKSKGLILGIMKVVREKVHLNLYYASLLSDVISYYLIVLVIGFLLMKQQFAHSRAH